MDYDERLVPSRPGEWEHRDSYLMYLRHLAAYCFAQPMAEGQRVLDLGCGTGYGAVLIASSAREVIALDVALNALPTAEPKTATATFVAGDSLRLPLRDETFDLVVSSQVIEHIWREIDYLDEVRRVLSPGGIFIVATPNRALRLLPFQPPINPYHVREYNIHSLKKTLYKQFAAVDIWGVRGTPEIMAIERERLRQNPLRAYRGLIASKILPSLVLKSIRNLVKSLPWARRLEATVGTNNVASPPFSEDDYLVTDFWVDPNDVETSLDLVGICHKH